MLLHRGQMPDVSLINYPQRLYVDAEGIRLRPLTGRLQFIDATRGAAMFLVFVAHFADTFFIRPGDFTAVLMRSIGLISSPTFALVNGLLIGFLYRTRPADFAAFRIKLLDRGLFLLTVGHCVMVGAHLARVPTLRWLLITDAIGVSVIVGPWLVSRVQPAHRLVIAVSGYAISWILIAWWHPASGFLSIVGETVFGSLHGTFYAYAFPLLPWFCLDFASTVIGERLASYYLAGDRDAMLRFITRLGITAFIVASAAEVVLLFFVGGSPSRHHELLFALAYLHQKSPPGPVYLVFHASLGLMLLSALLLVETTGRAQRLMSWAAGLGQTSLFAFVVQYYVYFTVVQIVHAHLPYPSAWPVYFVMTLALVLVPVREWHRRGFNRFITVGCQSMSQSWSALPASSIVEKTFAAR